MKSDGEAQQHTPKRPIVPPYNIREVEFFRSYIISGLKMLKDVGQKINFEEMCEEVIKLPDDVCAPEWVHDWQYWKSQYESKQSRKERDKVFSLCIGDLIGKGLMPLSEHIIGLTGNFDARVQSILDEVNKKK